LRAERRGGQLLRQQEKAKPPGDNQHKKADRSSRPTEVKTLKQMGITKDESSRYQKLAAIPRR